MRTIRYGPSPYQEADLYLPPTPHSPVVVLLHGGFWRMPYGREETTPIAEDLVSRGFAVWNLEYRRLGTPGAGWPGTMHDVALGLDHLAQLSANGTDLDLNRVAVVGHSAGGHLALWLGAQDRNSGDQSPRVRVRLAVGLAPIADLARAFELDLGRGAAAELLGGSPTQRPDAYVAASPTEMLPLRVPQLILHGTADDEVPIDLSRHYARAALAAGDPLELIELPAVGHSDFLNPASAAHAILCRRLLAILHAPLKS